MILKAIDYACWNLAALAAHMMQLSEIVAELVKSTTAQIVDGNN